MCTRAGGAWAVRLLALTLGVSGVHARAESIYLSFVGSTPNGSTYDTQYIAQLTGGTAASYLGTPGSSGDGFIIFDVGGFVSASFVTAIAGANWSISTALTSCYASWDCSDYDDPGIVNVQFTYTGNSDPTKNLIGPAGTIDLGTVTLTSTSGSYTPDEYFLAQDRNSLGKARRNEDYIQVPSAAGTVSVPEPAAIWELGMYLLAGSLFSGVILLARRRRCTAR